MATVDLQGISKHYPGVRALDDVCIAIESGEFFTLLGPSGCGKTTLLRTIAGFVEHDAGEVHIDGGRIDHLPPHRRDTAMVFQDYAIFPHMSVGDNVAFGLRNRHVPRAQMRERVADALATVRLSGYESRMPHELSGGQQQRVGLARAMIIRPKVLLMDEPLSNLDAKLRIELREDIRDIQRKLGITTVYVTHDQEEALVVSDRICIMRDGRILQIGTAWEVYKEPTTRFVASFVGSTNFIEPGTAGGYRHAPAGETPVAGHSAALLDDSGGSVVASIRPEDVRLLQPGAAIPADGIALDATVAKVSFTGREVLYYVRTTGGAEITVQVRDPAPAHLGATGSEVVLVLPRAALLFFDSQTGARL